MRRLLALISMTTLVIVCASAPASATFIAYRVAKDYFVIGADSRAIGTNASDRYCKIMVLDDTHVFTGEGLTGFRDRPSMVELAKRVLQENARAGTGDLLGLWMSAALSQMSDFYRDRPELIAGIPVTKGFFGEVRADGSKWSRGSIAMNEDRATWKQDRVIDQAAQPDFFTGDGGNAKLAVEFLRDQDMHATNSVTLDAMMMQRLVQFVIDRTPYQWVGGVPVVAALGYGKAPRWYAGGDICAP